MILPNAHSNNIIVMDSLFLPTLLFIVSFDINAKTRKISGINIL